VILFKSLIFSQWGIYKEAMFSPKQIISPVPTPKIGSVMMI
jgi:hypothetical protein